jgi:hypothetical protein
MPSPDPTSEAPATHQAAYRTTNWPAYDRALVARGDITFWFDPEALEPHWTPEPTGKRGAPLRYSDGAIQTLLVLKQVLDGAATAADDRPPHTFLAATPLWRLRFSPRRVPP